MGTTRMKVLLRVGLFCIAVTCLFISAATAWADDVQCTDIANIDFKNMDIDLHGNKLEQHFSFRNGKAQEIIEDEPEIPKQVEWEATIEKEMSVTPTHDVIIRFILIVNDHVGGTGEIGYLVGYGCFNGLLRQVFEQDGFTLNIDKMSRDVIILRTHPEYRGPFTKRFSYRWDPKTSIYVLREAYTVHDEEE